MILQWDWAFPALRGDEGRGGVGGVKVLAAGRTSVDWWWDINSLLWFSNYEHRMNMLYVYRNKNHHHNTNKKQHNVWKIDFLNNLCLHYYNRPDVKSLRCKTKPAWWWWCLDHEGLLEVQMLVWRLKYSSCKQIGAELPHWLSTNTLPWVPHHWGSDGTNCINRCTLEHQDFPLM